MIWIFMIPTWLVMLIILILIGYSFCEIMRGSPVRDKYLFIYLKIAPVIEPTLLFKNNPFWFTGFGTLLLLFKRLIKIIVKIFMH